MARYTSCASYASAWATASPAGSRLMSLCPKWQRCNEQHRTGNNNRLLRVLSPLTAIILQPLGSHTCWQQPADVITAGEAASFLRLQHCPQQPSTSTHIQVLHWSTPAAQHSTAQYSHTDVAHRCVLLMNDHPCCGCHEHLKRSHLKQTR